MQSTNELSAWHRKYWRPGGGNAFVLYAIFGDFKQPFEVSASKHRTTGLPEGVEVVAYTRAEHNDFIRGCYEGWMAEKLCCDDPELFAAVESAPMCLFFRGEVADPDNLIYLRNVIGLAMALMDTNGGIGLLDMQALRWYSPTQWNNQIFAPDMPYPRNHVVILYSEEPDGNGVWIHTRGMRKFGRPDISIHNVGNSERSGRC